HSFPTRRSSDLVCVPRTRTSRNHRLAAIGRVRADRPTCGRADPGTRPQQAETAGRAEVESHLRLYRSARSGLVLLVDLPLQDALGVFPTRVEELVVPRHVHQLARRTI